MISTEQTRQNLYDLLSVKNLNVVTRDAQGKETSDAGQADLFTFDYVAGEENNYGTVVVTITPEGVLEVFYGDRLGRSMESQDKADWYDFLYQLRHFARRNMMGFELKHMNKLKHAMKTMAAVTEGKYYGYKNTSYTKPTREAKLKIVHSRPIDEENGDARYRNVAKLYVETAEGERFKLPFTKLYAGRAMARHCSEGGVPYDEFGSHISETVGDIQVLEAFLRSAKGKEWTDAGADIMVEAGIRHLKALKKKVKKMIGRRGYKEQLDAFSPQQEQEHTETTDKIREMFTQTLLDQRIEEAIPVLNKLEARDSVMKEISEFESWADDTTALDLDEGFDPESFEGEVKNYEFAGDDGEPGYGGIYYTAMIDPDTGQVMIDPKSLKAYCDGDARNKLSDEWCTEMVQPGGYEHEEAMQAAQEHAEQEWNQRDRNTPMEDQDLEEGRMKELAMDLDNLSDEEFEKKYQTKKSDWREGHKSLRQDPDQPVMISKDMKEQEVYEGPTRKDFQMVADLLKANPDEAKRKELAKDYCDKFAKMNPRFDKSRFMKACGINEDDMGEGNEFSHALAQAREQGKKEFEVDGKIYKVKESELDRIKFLSGL